MLLRNALMTVLTGAALLVVSPDAASAQSNATGRDRAVEVGAAQNAQVAPGHMPRGLEGRDDLPPGIEWTRGDSGSGTTPPEDDGGDGGDDEFCIPGWDYSGLFPVYNDCGLP